MKKVTLLVSGLLSFLTFAPTAFANHCNPLTEIHTDLGCLPSDPGGFAQEFYGIGLGLISGIALIFIIYGGYLIMTSRGNPDQLSKGRSYIFYSIAGLLLTIFGYVFFELITVDILHLPGFGS